MPLLEGDSEGEEEEEIIRNSKVNGPNVSRIIPVSYEKNTGALGQGRAAKKGTEKAPLPSPDYHLRQRAPSVGTETSSFRAPVITQIRSTCKNPVERKTESEMWQSDTGVWPSQAQFLRKR